MRINKMEKEENDALHATIEFFGVDFNELTSSYGDELYRLRKITFSDRLGWDVSCSGNMEFDEFDNAYTHYLLGVCNGHILCSVRFIGLDRPNMINRTFSTCFGDIRLPESGVESSRFFVDKDRASQFSGPTFPVSHALYLAVISWAHSNGLPGIHTIVSRSMLTILKRTGWNITVLREAFLSEQEPIYLLFLPTTDKDLAQMALKFAKGAGSRVPEAAWPMTLSV